MYGWRGILSGALALIVLEAVVSSPSATAHVGGLFDFANELAKRFIDPTVPAIAPRTAPPLSPAEGSRYATASSHEQAAPGAPATKEGFKPPPLTGGSNGIVNGLLSGGLSFVPGIG